MVFIWFAPATTSSISRRSPNGQHQTFRQRPEGSHSHVHFHEPVIHTHPHAPDVHRQHRH
ncbi:MAG: hypothetical protein EON50_01640 [Acidovorax sp.]|nr:MAG: hypothetical protein EON50_01640 [Acidovorax sp.]